MKFVNKNTRLKNILCDILYLQWSIADIDMNEMAVFGSIFQCIVNDWFSLDTIWTP